MLRFAPSPTSDMNIESLRVAIVNFLVSQQKKENFVICMKDLDSTKNIEGKDTEIMQILEKFALTHSSVFHQSEHLHMHQTLAIKLLEQNRAFICTCSLDELDTACSKKKCASKTSSDYKSLKKSKTPFVIRIKKPLDDIIINDLIQGETITTPNEVGDFVILKEDGIPTSNFASACDDMLSGITMVLEEKTSLSHTSQQHHIKKQLGYEQETLYAHLPTMLNSSTTIKSLFEEGFVPDAIINYLLLLGNENIATEIFTLPDAIEWFNLKTLSKSSASFDIEKLRFINTQHLKNMDNKELSTLFGFADAQIGKLAKLYLKEANTTKELQAKIKAIFSPKTFEGEHHKEMTLLKDIIQDAPMIQDFEIFQNYLIQKSGLEKENLLTPLTLLLTNNTHNGPELCDLFPLINPYLLEIAS